MGGHWQEWKPVVAMLMVNVVFATTNTLIKKVIDDGLNQVVLITVRQLLATLFIAPVAYFRERETRPKMTTKIFVYLFFSALLGSSLTQYLFFVGLEYTSATFSCAFLNMVPVFTFILAIPFGLERVNVRSKSGICEGDRACGLCRRRDAAHVLPGHRIGRHIPPRSGAEGASSIGGGGGSPRCSGRRRREREMDGGDDRAVRRHFLLGVVVPPPVEAQQEVSGPLLQYDRHLLPQFPPSCGPHLRHSEERLFSDLEEEVRNLDPHICRGGWIGVWLRSNVLVRREARSRIHLGIQSSHSDHGRWHRCHHSARTTLPRERSWICACNCWTILPFVGKEQGHPDYRDKAK
ncbi:WAT1-related protein-like [Iris pallida]|uniref:WAT1-related protein n=1 Tax=Iris pallida TaxID=29817 RepID=A0AAX6FLR0_IRIPA|nr:WAT1-related protein-like [Iris pallida]